MSQSEGERHRKERRLEMASLPSTSVFTAPPPPSLPMGPVRSSPHLVDELEATFEACCASLVSQDYVNSTDQEEIRTGVEQAVSRFIEVARQVEMFFLQKRLQLSSSRPDLLVREEVNDLRSELQRKEALLRRHLDKLRNWSTEFDDLHSGSAPQPHLTHQQLTSMPHPPPHIGPTSMAHPSTSHMR
uniref:mediator of RNA polymerase II transcription subunit 28 isoform X1 n=1 Tax=Myxine glutinosa TaxID=7769 RepID=UPI00358FB133